MSEIKRLSEEIGLDKISTIKRTCPTHYPLHWHEYYEIEYILEGHGIYTVNNVPYSIAPGSLVFVTPIDFASLTLHGKSLTLLNISFAEDWISDKIINSLTVPTVINSYNGMLPEKLYDELNSVNKFKDVCVKYLLGCILVDVIRAAPPGSRKNELADRPPIVTDMLFYIQLHFREDLTLNDLAEYVGLSPNYLSKVFHDHIGKTFKAHLISTRLKYASTLLCNTDALVTDVCYRSGFNSFTHFLRCFKQKYNTSPAQYRKQNSG